MFTLNSPMKSQLKNIVSMYDAQLCLFMCVCITKCSYLEVIKDLFYLFIYMFTVCIACIT